MRRALATLATALTPALALAAAAAPAQAAAGLDWKPSTTGVESPLFGLSAVSDRVAWAGGSGGVLLRTADGGGAWQNVSPPNSADADFRDIEAISDREAVALSAGAGGLGRVYRTDDGGATWTETFRSVEEKSFYNCVAFFDAQRGIAMSDPVGGKFRIITTADGGRSWSVVPDAGMPASPEGEYGFSGSGSCLVTPPGAPTGTAVFASGGSVTSRYFHTTDYGVTWTAAPTGFPAAEYGGVHSLAFRGGRGVAVGGDSQAAPGASGGAAVSGDNGFTWAMAAARPADFRGAAAWVSDSTVVAVGPTGSDASTDGGNTWAPFSNAALTNVACAASGGCFAVGPKGAAATLVGTR
ncbi:oxidoreductase [Pilimelia terevasa]|uniref:Oxidoreductase n=1 Tax=Pilimelia terevasa TaxID=53372 RepID=A0A8J3FJM9_9ACTN|nr:oxidoreductase [Pilimelia terevasa]GGK41404.1 oxidoreductase [Pilimelia terevasa]